jgi:hypothetical protein
MVKEFAWNLSGARVRFSLDADYLCISAFFRDVCMYANMSPGGTSGMQLYMESDDGYTRIKSILPQLVEIKDYENKWPVFWFGVPANRLCSEIFDKKIVGKAHTGI